MLRINVVPVFSWILSRNRQLTANATVQVNQVVNSIMDLNNRYFTQSNRSDSDCFYYPIAAPNQAVIFRGQCSDSIPVVQNFDATRVTIQTFQSYDKLVPVLRHRQWITSLDTVSVDGKLNSAINTKCFRWRKISS